MGSASSAPKAAAPAVDPLPAPPKRRGSLSKVEIPGAVTPKAAEGVMLSIVTNKTERKLFETYLANEFCEEIIRFWKERALAGGPIAARPPSTKIDS